MIRPLLALVGLPPLVVLAGLVYGTAFVRSSHYGAFFLFCIVYGFLCWLVFAASRCVRSTAALWLPVLVAAWVGPFVLGHYNGYADSRYTVWRMVQDDTEGVFDPAWKALDRREAFDRYVASTTGNRQGGFPAYLSLMAHEGWSGYERTSGLAMPVERRGIWVWVAWGMHLVFLLVATAAAMGATIPAEVPPSERRTPSKRPASASPAVASRGTPQSRAAEPVATASITAAVTPENEQAHDGWWLLSVSFRGRKALFRKYSPDAPPTARGLFEDIHHALYRLRGEGPLAALAVLGSVEGGATADEALEQLMADDRKIRSLLGGHYSLFENDERFFAVFF